MMILSADKNLAMLGCSLSARSGHRVGLFDHLVSGRMVAVPRDQCLAMAGRVELPFEGGRRHQAPKPMKASGQFRRELADKGMALE
jgi:hypothetical protein